MIENHYNQKIVMDTFPYASLTVQNISGCFCG
jgi:hypothetical protein